jgi:hypothetical protein
VGPVYSKGHRVCISKLNKTTKHTHTLTNPCFLGTGWIQIILLNLVNNSFSKVLLHMKVSNLYDFMHYVKMQNNCYLTLLHLSVSRLIWVCSTQIHILFFSVTTSFSTTFVSESYHIESSKIISDCNKLGRAKTWIQFKNSGNISGLI